MRGHPSRLLLLGCLVSLPACAPEGPVLEVSVDGLTAEVRAMEVTATLEDRPAWTSQSIRRDLSRFLVRLPAGTRGHVVLSVSGLDGDQCVVSAGAVGQAVTADARHEVGVTLTERADKGCKLHVERAGIAGGRVRSDPPGIDCPGTCAASFPRDTTVRLTATPDPASSFGGWAGACQGQGACALRIDSGATRVVASFIPPPVCSVGRWCWDDPRPAGTTAIRALWGSGPKDVWAAGADGVLLRWTGSFWGGYPSGVTHDLSGLWGSGPDDIWAVGSQQEGETFGSVVLRFDGKGWTRVLSPPAGVILSGVSGSGPGDVWAVGYDSGGGRFATVSLHWTGVEWISVPPQLDQGGFSAVWQRSKDDVWAGGIL